LFWGPMGGSIKKRGGATGGKKHFLSPHGWGVRGAPEKTDTNPPKKNPKGKTENTFTAVVNFGTPLGVVTNKSPNPARSARGLYRFGERLRPGGTGAHGRSCISKIKGKCIKLTVQKSNAWWKGYLKKMKNRPEIGKHYQTSPKQILERSIK